MSTEEVIPIDLDPKKVIASLRQISEEAAKLSQQMDESLGKKAAQSVEDLEDAAEKGTGKISEYFRNLGTKIKEDLKTAFDLGAVTKGLKFADDLASGIKQVFEMERAFDRLNTRLGYSAEKMAAFKTQLGQTVAGTGQKLQDVLPGVETAAAKGGITDSNQLNGIGKSLGQAKAITGEDTANLSSQVIDILKNSGQAVTGANFKNVMDALEGTRVNGAFKTAGEAGSEIAGISRSGAALGLSTRQLGGLAAQASQSGEGGLNILNQLLEKGNTIGGQQQLNAVLGTNVFKNGKLDTKALGGIDTSRFGQYSSQVMEQATGLQGANGQDLVKFVQAFKGGTGNMDRVIGGANETAAQFDVATDNLASKIDQFKEKAKEAGREVTEGLSQMAAGFLKGDMLKASQGMDNAIKATVDNAGTIAGSLAVTAGVGVLAGGAAKSLLSKVGGGAGGVLGSVVGAEAAKAAGVQQVYVVNMPLGGVGGGAGGTLGALGGTAGKVLGAGAAAVIGYEIGDAIMKSDFLGVKTGSGKATDKIYDALYGDSAKMQGENKQWAASAASYNERNGTNLSPDEFAQAVEKGTLAAHSKSQGRVNYTNPSTVHGRAAGG